MRVLILGEADLPEVDLLSEAVQRRDGDSVVCDTTDWPGDAPISYRPEEDSIRLGTDVRLDGVSGVYAPPTMLFRPYRLRFHDALSENPRSTLHQLREHRAMFESVCYTLEERGADVVPPIRQYDWHSRKPWQLTLCNDESLPVPDTLFTNSPDEVVQFYETHDEVVYKPVTRGGSPRKLTEEDLTDDRLADLSTAPVQFQAFVPGDDVRIYFVDEDVVGGIRYVSERFSFKLDMEDGAEVDVEPFVPSGPVEAAVERVATALDLPFGAVDVRWQSNDEFKILEVNDVPRFAAADLQGEQDVAGELASYLVGE